MGARTTAFDAEVFTKPCDTRAIEKRSTVSRCYACYMVAWDGIEPTTRGFSIAVFVQSLAFMRVTARKRVTCYRPCYTKNTEFRDTFLGFGNFTLYYIKHTSMQNPA